MLAGNIVLVGRLLEIGDALLLTFCICLVEVGL